jgi:hypothetical protein
MSFTPPLKGEILRPPANTSGKGIVPMEPRRNRSSGTSGDIPVPPAAIMAVLRKIERLASKMLDFMGRAFRLTQANQCRQENIPAA